MTTDQRSLLAASTIVLALGLSACGEIDGTADPDDERFTRTVVTVNEDGTETVRQYVITKQQRARDIERKRIFAEGKYTAAIVEDDSCPTQAFWMYDLEGLSGNQLCVILSPKSPKWSRLNLDTYPRPGGTWAGNVRSFYAGEDVSLFSDALHCNKQYDPYTRMDTGVGCYPQRRFSMRSP